jgi:hypothetical protein
MILSVVKEVLAQYSYTTAVVSVVREKKTCHHHHGPALMLDHVLLLPVPSHPNCAFAPLPPALSFPKVEAAAPMAALRMMLIAEYSLT